MATSQATKPMTATLKLVKPGKSASRYSANVATGTGDLVRLDVYVPAEVMAEQGIGESLTLTIGPA